MLAVPLVRPGDVSDAERAALARGALVAELSGYVRYELTGPGRVTVLQGIVTCDVEKTGGETSLFGALLTNKGMIVTPLWIFLLPDKIIVEAPALAAGPLRETFTRTMPPRLCRARDITSESRSILVLGPQTTGEHALPALARGTNGVEAIVAPDFPMPAGDVRASDALLERCRIEAMVPRLGAEIDDRTLPQEVGLDVLGAVSFTKGCYIGQETVARLKYRGHANRRLVSVDLAGEPAALPLELTRDGKTAGRLTSAAWSDDANGWIGLAVVRRDVEDGATLDNGIAVRGERRIRPA